MFPQEGPPSGAGGSWGIKGRDGVTAEPEGCHPAGGGTLEGGAGRLPGVGETRGGKGSVTATLTHEVWGAPSLMSGSTSGAGATQKKGC